MNPGNVLGHLTFALIIFLLLPTGKLPLKHRLLALAGGMILSLVPINDLSLANYMRSITNDLSTTTLLWLSWSAGARIGGFRVMPERQHLQLALCFSVLALLLYPAALGLSMFDPYSLGYAPRFLLLFVFAISIVLWLIRHYFGAALLTAATAVFMLDFRAPDNYWDYLIDPLLALYCLSVLGWHGMRWLSSTLNKRFDLILPAKMHRQAFANSQKRLVRSRVTNLCAEEPIKNPD